MAETRSIAAEEVSGVVLMTVPGSKSLTNRALLCAALADGESTLVGGSDSDDTGLLVNGLNQLGILARRTGRDLIVEGKGGRVFAPRFPVPVGNAGTTFRFLLALSALSDGTVAFEVDGRMADRPVEPLLEGLRALGAEVEALPFAGRYAVRGGTFHGGEAVVDASQSSQFLSSLLLVAPYAGSPVVLKTAGRTVSAPYVTMTTHVMNSFGVPIDFSDGRCEVPVGQYQPTVIPIEVDRSSAAFLLAGGMVRGVPVTVAGIDDSSVQGDSRILEILRLLGSDIDFHSNGVTLTPGPDRYAGLDIDCSDCPDLVPPLIALLLFAAGSSTIRNVGHLRFKESDRIQVLERELQKMGASIAISDETIVIDPVELQGCALDPEGDHRLAMAFAVIGLHVIGTTILGPACVSKSFPQFWSEFKKLEGGQ